MLFFFFAKNRIPNNSLQQLLTSYYNIKNALANDDGNKAGIAATQLSGNIKTANTMTLTAAEQKAFTFSKRIICKSTQNI